jgi:L-amino acid N-acyltransferase YncA
MRHLITDASEADLPGILAIYQRRGGVHHGDLERDPGGSRQPPRLAAERTASGFPVLVARDVDGEVLGYASYGTWRSIEGFRHTVEHSVYVRADQRARAWGRC